MAETIQDILAAWGRARMIGDPPNGYTAPHYTSQIQNPGEQADKARTAPLPDDDHIRVDVAVSALRSRKPDHYRVIYFAYQRGMPDSKIAECSRWGDTNEPKERRSRSWVRTIRENAEHWLDGRLE